MFSDQSKKNIREDQIDEDEEFDNSEVESNLEEKHENVSFFLVKKIKKVSIPELLSLISKEDEEDTPKEQPKQGDFSTFDAYIQKALD